MHRLAIACVLCLLALGVHAQSKGIYKWKDARGVTHYSDTPPANARYAEVQADAAARVAAPVPQAALDPRCVTARTNIERLRSGGADIGLDRDGDGNADAPLPESQRADQLRMAEAAARNFCPRA